MRSIWPFENFFATQSFSTTTRKPEVRIAERAAFQKALLAKSEISLGDSGLIFVWPDRAVFVFTSAKRLVFFIKLRLRFTLCLQI